jgi:histone H3/H4
MSYSESRDLRAAVQYAVAQICTEQELSARSEMSSGAIQALSELTFQYATTSLSNDLQAFSSHANRKLINVDDVMLIARKNATLRQKLNVFSDATLSPPTRKRQTDTIKSRSAPCIESEINSVSFREKLIRNMDSTQESESDNDHLDLVATSKVDFNLGDSDSSSTSEAEMEKENLLMPTLKTIDRSIDMLNGSSDDDDEHEPMWKRLKSASRHLAASTDLTDTDESS